MPELPEVETARRGIAAAFGGGRIARVVVRERRLRWPLPRELEREIAGRRLAAAERRAKFLLLRLEPAATVIVHLGMSGSLRIVAGDTAPAKHDHVDFVFGDGRVLRLRDPRRFGCVLWCGADPLAHPLLRDLGPEPLTAELDGAYLYRRARGRRLAVKSYLMDSRIVVGVGNIYATEALHAAGIHPARAAGRISTARYERLAGAIKQTLLAAIDKGGTTLRDFVDGRGEPGYFGAELRAYGRGGQPCTLCGATLRHRTLGQRSSFYCPGCQR